MYAAPPASGAGSVDPAILAKGKPNTVCFMIAHESGTGRCAGPFELTCVIVAMSSTTPALAQDVTLLEKFKDWSAYAAAGTPKVCFAVAKPKTGQCRPRQASNAAPSFSTSPAGPPTGSPNEVSVKMGYPFGLWRQSNRHHRHRQVRAVHQGRRGIRREAGDGDQAGRRDEDRHLR